MRSFLATLLLCLFAFPAHSSVSDGKEFLGKSYSQSGRLILTKDGRRYVGHATITITPRNAKAARELKRAAKIDRKNWKAKRYAKKAVRYVAPKAARAQKAVAQTAGGSHLVQKARAYIGMNAQQIGLKRYTLWCATFINYLTGGGTGSDLAASWARQKPRVSPQVGAVAVMPRFNRSGKRVGDHVGVVSGFDRNGNPILISGNHNNRVREAAYPARRIYAYVMP